VTQRKYEPGVKEALEGLVEDFRNALINEANNICEFGGFDTISFLALESSAKIVSAIFRSVVKSATLGSFGEGTGDFLNEAFDGTADRRVTITMAHDIRDRLGEDLPDDIKKKLDDILNTIDGEEPTDEPS